MTKVTANMPLTETSKLMDSLEKNFEDLEVKTKVMDDAMQNATTVQQPVDQVANLMREMADEAGIELNLNMPTAPAVTTSVAMREQVSSFVRQNGQTSFFIFFSAGRVESTPAKTTRRLNQFESKRCDASEDDPVQQFDFSVRRRMNETQLFFSLFYSHQLDIFRFLSITCVQIVLIHREVVSFLLFC